MRHVLEKYNEILRQTFIDIPFLEKPNISKDLSFKILKFSEDKFTSQ